MLKKYKNLTLEDNLKVWPTFSPCISILYKLKMTQLADTMNTDFVYPKKKRRLEIIFRTE